MSIYRTHFPLCAVLLKDDSYIFINSHLVAAEKINLAPAFRNFFYLGWPRYVAPHLSKNKIIYVEIELGLLDQFIMLCKMFHRETVKNNFERKMKIIRRKKTIMSTKDKTQNFTVYNEPVRDWWWFESKRNIFFSDASIVRCVAVGKYTSDVNTTHLNTFRFSINCY